MRRVLATYSWQEARKRLFVPDGGFVDEEGWHVELPPRMMNADAILLAHLQHDEYAIRQAKSIYAQMEAAQGADGGKHIFLKVLPWFQGPAKLEVRGKWFDASRREFLALQIRGGCIGPSGPPVFLSREAVRTDGEDDSGADAGAGAPVHAVGRQPLFAPLVGDMPPDLDSGSIEVWEDDFKCLGPGRKVMRETLKERPASRHGALKKDDSSAFSGGEAHGSGKNVGKAAIKSELVIESQGMLMDMWNALRDAASESGATLEYFSGKTFRQGAEPELVSFRTFISDEGEFSDEQIKWTFLSVRSRTPRGMLVARLSKGGTSVHFIEIQRRALKPRGKQKDEGDEDPGIHEESYRGVVFLIDGDSRFDAALARVAELLIRQKGKAIASPRGFGGKIETYIHRTSRVSPRGEKELKKADFCANIVRNALGKVGAKM